MSFPANDQAWVDAAAFLDGAVRPGERVLAPDLFWWKLGRIHRFVRVNLSVPPDFDWVVVHKDDTTALPRPFVDALLATFTLAFASDVFVVFTRRADVEALEAHDPDVDAFVTAARALPIEPRAPLTYESDRIMGTEPILVNYATYSAPEMRAAYQHFFHQGGYLYPTARDRSYHHEVHGELRLAMQRWDGGRVLELCCAAIPIVVPYTGGLVVRSDLSQGAIELARTADRDAHAGPAVTYAVADAERLAFPDASFDAVSLVDAIEHLRDAGTTIDEAARVLVDGGEFLLTFANRNSLNYVLHRKLGFGETSTNHQHIAEFTLAEIREMLERNGLEVVETGGIELRPYLGVPGVDDIVREIVDNDDEVVEILRALGRRAGAEYAYVGVVTARKTSPARRDRAAGA
jgi:ubiquinone/menaquinone biosynthesis C-methylase UbiE